MNEVELIRAQLSLERQHAAAVSHALSAAAAQGDNRLAALDAFREASVEYLAWILSRFEEREQVFHDLIRARLSAEDASRHSVETTFALRGTSREALAKLEAALGAEVRSAATSDSGSAQLGSAATSRQSATENAIQTARWADFLLFFDGPWSARRDALDKLFAQQARTTDWRALSGIDADSILDERSRYARVRATLPEGVELPATTSHA
jgi:nucleotidyltransferase/DNA polymerase involved in DNA repair